MKIKSQSANPLRPAPRGFSEASPLRPQSEASWRTKIKNNEKGFASIVSTIIIMSVGLIIISSFIFFSIGQQRILRNDSQSNQSFYAAESGLEDATYRIRNNITHLNSYNLTVGTSTTAVNITTTGDTQTIESNGQNTNKFRKLQNKLKLSSVTPQFFYGVQVGEGGVLMQNNSQIIGNVYSNGSIIGNNGARIQGTANVAIGASPTPDQSFTTQNSNYGVGTTSGSVITTIDSAGDVGTYTSLGLGSDNFGRISYINNTNNDLKFAHCLNDTCSSATITTVASSDNIDEVTSLALDANNLAFITYYDDGNDDQEFVRCTNADCTTKNFTTIESTSNVGDTSSIKLGADGFPRIAYFQDTNGDVKFARCADIDCTTKIVNIVESANYLGEWLSLALGSDGFSRISYYNDTTDDLKFARCLDADCATKNINIVDSADMVGKHNSLILGTDGFARISYYDETNFDLKFARCLDADCATKIITTVDSANSVGEYTSLALDNNNLARISYYASSNSSLKFAQCLDIDCLTKTISTIESANSVGRYNSLKLGSDGFARISYYDASTTDLKFARCLDAQCSPPDPQVDVAQSFRTTITSRIVKSELYVKKTGNPTNAMLYIIRDNSGSPSVNSNDILATGLINTSKITNNYGWLSVSFTTTPTLTANTTYWLVIDSTLDNSNYLIWGGDSNNGYLNGTGKKTSDRTLGNWTNLNADLNFKIYLGGIDYQINNVTVDANVNAHIIETVNAGGNINAFSFNNGTVSGNINAESISNCTITGNASYNLRTNCAVNGISTTPTTPPDDPPNISMPISQANIDQWKSEAQSGGTFIGDYNVTANISLGPKEITGNLNMPSNNKILTLTGIVYVHGNIDISNGSMIRCAVSYGSNSCLILNDGWIHLSNNGIFQGSGTAGSYIMLLTTILNCNGGSQLPQCGHHNAAIDLHNNAAGAIFYASNSMINMHNGVNVTEAVGYKLSLDQNATVTYEQGLQSASFTFGPGASLDISDWKEIP